jgi:lysophospholipase L1-like esterase
MVRTPDMPKPIRHVVSAMSAADFGEQLAQNAPAAFDDPLILAEGDSWFNKFYPTGDNLLDQLDLPRGSRIIDHSWSGDKADDMFGAARLEPIAQYLDLAEYDAILLSAGGNDIISQIGNLLDGNGNAAALDAEKVADAFQKIETLLRAFCYSRNGTRNAETRIFIHAYDFVTPRDAPVKNHIAGPWVYPRLVANGVTDPQVQCDLLKDLLTRWQARLAILAEPASPQHVPGFHVLLSQGVLEPATSGTTSRSGDWEDEIHPTKAGYRKLAARLYNPVLRAVIDGA